MPSGNRVRFSLFFLLLLGIKEKFVFYKTHNNNKKNIDILTKADFRLCRLFFIRSFTRNYPRN